MPQSSSSQIKKIAIGADHGGFALKGVLMEHLSAAGYEVVDCGTWSDESVDYPVFAYAVASKVASGECDRGIMIDGAGIGSAMVANKVKGVRAALCYDLSSAHNSREHNNANVLTLGAGLIGPVLAKQIVDLWLTVECKADRHLRRVQMINEIEEGKIPVSELKNSNDTQLSPQDLEKIFQRLQTILKDEFGIGLNDLEALRGIHPMDGRGVSVEKNHQAMKNFIDMGVERITSSLGNSENLPKEIAKYIDHTLLKPDATEAQIRQLCEEALKYEFASVCVNPVWVPLVAEMLRGSNVKTCSVVGFPFGTHTPEVKAMETRQVIRAGAKEVDMVINIGALKSGNDDLVYRDIRAVVEACDDGGAICKVIIETCLLTDEEKVRACQLAKKAKAEFVKTSTGFAGGGATAEDVALMREAVKGTKMEVKASGGIRSFADMQKMLRAGATRIGASAGIKIIQEAKEITESN
ncbi:MAG: hypothetical protein Kow0037_27030 [Calditrichia bacterium]